LVADCGEGGAVARPLQISYPGAFYKAILAEIDEYAKELSRYLQLNPVRAEIGQARPKKKTDTMEKRFQQLIMKT
jgi:hypothetical protein